jgi:hypothetical protein
MRILSIFLKIWSGAAARIAISLCRAQECLLVGFKERRLAGNRLC